MYPYNENKSDVQVYQELMKFIVQTNDSELLKDALTEALDNSNDTSIIYEAHYKLIEYPNNRK